MLLTETISNCTSAVRKWRASRESKQHVDVYMKSLQQLSGVSSKLKNSVECAVALKDNGLMDTPVINGGLRDEILNCIDECGQGLADMALTTKVVNQLRDNSNKVSEQVKNAWRNASRDFVEGPRGYLTLIGSLSDDSRRAQELADAMTKAVSGEPSVKVIKRLTTQVEEATRMTEEFSLSPEVEDFLKKVSTRRATVSDLTPGVLMWLEEKKLGGKLRIRF